jgi:hypothetical protein
MAPLNTSTPVQATTDAAESHVTLMVNDETPCHRMTQSTMMQSDVIDFVILMLGAALHVRDPQLLEDELLDCSLAKGHQTCHADLMNMLRTNRRRWFFLLGHFSDVCSH